MVYDYKRYLTGNSNRSLTNMDESLTDCSTPLFQRKLETFLFTADLQN